MTLIMPGVYDDGEGGLHINVSELLRANGFADTPLNRDTLTRVAQDMLRRQYPAIRTVTVVE